MRMIVIGILTFCLLLLFVSAQANTTLEISNSLPALILSIPNFTWAQNTNLVPAFNLNNYFIDYNGDTMTFYFTNHSNLANILVTIDQTTGNVSFYPALDFVGTETVNFVASDGFGNTTSNLVYLNVGTDTESPRWSNVSSHANVSQNTEVTFSVRWTDNVQLASFIFSISQNGVWTNYSTQDNQSNLISGLFNFSNYTLTISAAPSSTVFWKIYAFDTSDNINVTDEQNFTVNSLPASTGGTDTTSGSNSGGVTSSIQGGISSFLQNTGLVSVPFDFIIEPKSLNLELFQGDSRSAFFTISNVGTDTLDLQLVLLNIDDLALLVNPAFSLDSGDSKEILLDFTVPKRYQPGQYFGLLKITGNGLSQSIPIVVLIKEFDPSITLDVIVLDDSKLVKPGKSVFFDIEASQIDFEKEAQGTLYLAVKDFYGTIYDSKEREAVVGVKSTYSESLTIPEDAKEGDYLVYARLEYDNRSAIDSDIFQVGYRYSLASFIRIGGTFFYIFLLAIVFALLALNYERKKRKEKLLNLYLLLSQMKDHLRNNNLEAAAKIYIRIKTLYGQQIPVEIAADKEFLKSELVRLTKAIESSSLMKAEVAQKTESTPSKEEAVPVPSDESIKSATSSESSNSPEQTSSQPDQASKPSSSSESSSKEVTKPVVEHSNSPSSSTPSSTSSSKENKSPLSQSPTTVKKPVVKKVVKKIIKKVVKKTPTQNIHLKEGST